MLQATPKCPKCSSTMSLIDGMYCCDHWNCGAGFTIQELTGVWGFDAADFYGKVMATNFPEPIADIHFDYVSFEPLWMNDSERIYSYELVTEMLDTDPSDMLKKFPYVDDYTDLLQTQEYAK